METLLLLMCGSAVASLVSFACYAAVVIHLFRHEGWRRAIVGFAFPPYAFAWGWRHCREPLRGPRFAGWMTVWTCAASYLIVAFAFVEAAMG